MAITGDATSTVPAGTLPYTTKLVESQVMAATQDLLFLPGHPAIVDLTQMSAQLNVPRGQPLAGTLTIQIDQAAGAWASTNESTGVASPTQIDPTYFALSFVNYEKVYASTDELRRRDATGLYGPSLIAGRLILGWMLTETDLICDLADSMSNIVGAATDPCSWDLIREARDELSENTENMPGNRLCVLASAQWPLVLADIESRGGAIQMRRVFDTAQDAGLGNYKGTYDGVDFYVTSRINVSGGVYSGMMVAPGGIGIARLKQAVPTASTIVVMDVGDGTVLVEEKRNFDDRETVWAGRSTFGAGIVKQSHCVRIRSTGRT